VSSRGASRDGHTDRPAERPGGPRLGSEHPAKAVAERCLSCTNCTLVPYLLLHERRPAVRSRRHDHLERTWDSCFADGFAKVAGGSFGHMSGPLPPVADSRLSTRWTSSDRVAAPAAVLHRGARSASTFARSSRSSRAAAAEMPQMASRGADRAGGRARPAHAGCRSDAAAGGAEPPRPVAS
jgi:hypothetical protein